jgi:hypothetical protein
LGVTTDIERICSHQNASHRLYSRIKIYLRHFPFSIRLFMADFSSFPAPRDSAEVFQFFGAPAKC